MAAFLLLYLSLLIFSLRAQAQYASIPSSSMPMFVKTPYLNAWLPYINATAPGTVSPVFYFNWNLGYTGLIRVDGQTYRWMGSAGSDNIPPAETVVQYISPTRTVLVMNAGTVQMNVTWLSPIEPDDWIKQSFPFTYYYIDIATSDGMAHDIQLYTDITGEWVAKDTSTVINWDTGETDTIVYHQVKAQSQQAMKEIDSMAADVTIYLAAVKAFNSSWQIGANHSIPQASFTSNGTLDNSKNTDFRAIDTGYPALSFSYDLSLITSTNTSVVWALGAVRDPTIYYGTLTNPQLRSAPYWSKASSISDSMNDFISDFPNAITRADALDNKIMSDGLMISSDYADLLALCLRQAMAGFEITISKDNNGNWNETDVKTFMKDSGTTSRVNAVDRVYASFPTLLYLNASLAGTVLNPILEMQADFGGYSSVGDLGPSFPAALGNTTSDISQTITYNGDMLFMLAAHAKKSGDTSLILIHYDMLKRWADFLVSSCLYPGSKYTTSNGANYGVEYPNMSNLALQGIVGIHAMSAIAEILGKMDDMKMYSGNASTYLAKWQTLAFYGDHLITAYQSPLSWSLMYNLYGAKMIGLDVDQGILDAQSQYYQLQASSAPQFGFPWTSEGAFVRSYWNFLTAATTTNTASRDVLIGQIHKRLFWNGTIDFPFPSTYDKNSGASNGFPGGRAGPTLGAAFAHLALNVPDKILTSSTNSTTIGIQSSQTPTPTPTPSKSSTAKRNNNAGIITGAVLGSLFGFLALCTGAFFLYKRRDHRRIYVKKSLFPNDTPTTSPTLSEENGWPPSRSQTARNDVLFNPMHVQPAMRSLPLNALDKQRDVIVLQPPMVGPVSKPPLTNSGSGETRNSSRTNSSNSAPVPVLTESSPTLRDELYRMRRELNEMRVSETHDIAPPIYYLGGEADVNR
ncbi:hypothetical protein BDQ17DRAFT_1432228 [Cyathus striatus]|nr:hypothetical protein BDQ17DRAFT_1432228 [Cyathus striatus]